MKYSTDLVFDISPLGEPTGIGNYVKWALFSFQRVKEVRIALVFRKERSVGFLKNYDFPSNFSLHFFPFNRLKFKREVLRRFSFERFLSPDYYVLDGSRDAAVVHDLSPFDFPSTLSLKARILYRWELKRTAKLGRLILADSEFTRARFKEVFGRESRVIYPPFFPCKREKEVKLPEK